MIIAADAGRSALVPADMRVANLARIVQEMRSSGGLSRSDVARRIGMSLPTAHRLMSDLVELGLVDEESTVTDGARLGRPPVVYNFRDDAAVLAAVDAGNQATRLALTTLAGYVLASVSLPSDQLGRDLPATLARKVGQMLEAAQVPADRLAGVGVGIAAWVDAGGVLRDPPVHQDWNGLALHDFLQAELDCGVVVAQDDHLSPIAESSDRGTFPDASSLLVLEIGRGIGAGMMLDGRPVAGARGRFGRVAGWPVARQPGGGGTTLGECLVTHGLIDQYRSAGGTGRVADTAVLADLARAGDQPALAVFSWAAAEIADVVDRLSRLCDPEAIVLGGGLMRAFDLIEPGLRQQLSPAIRAEPSVLGERAVLVGAEIAAGSFVEGWLSARLSRT